MPEVNLAAMEPRQIYGFLMCAVVPRPIGLVTTLADNGAVNAAPFSSFIALSPMPPIVGFVCGGWQGHRKDTQVNIERRAEFAISVVSEDMAMAVEQCGAALPPGESEIARTGLALAPSRHIAPPYLAASPIAFECRLERFVPFGGAPDMLIAGRVLAIYAAEGVVSDGRVNTAAWRPLGRVGAGAFCHLSRPFRVASVDG
ncbi:MAG: flavin reductase family protein [Candidatus Odyssella sp.]|nr:flavin reductase family protein [Candidatus Odyssella sp.]